MKTENMTSREMNKIEKACEGKTVLTLTFNIASGIIIRFTDGSVFRLFFDGFDGEVIYDESNSKTQS